jgi:hypothetical protein
VRNHGTWLQHNNKKENTEECKGSFALYTAPPPTLKHNTENNMPEVDGGMRRKNA